MKRYGASPLHFVAHLGAFAVAAYALSQIVRAGFVVNFIVWFGGAALLHDLVLLPLYSALDRIAHRVVHRPHARRVPAINHVRIPALLSGLLLLVYFPLILRLSDHNYFSASGHHIAGYARNWLLITAAMFALSGATYGVRVARRRRRRGRLNADARGPGPGPPPAGPPPPPDD